MLTISSAPAAACSAMGPNGTQESSQIERPMVTPATSTSGPLPSPAVKYRCSSKTV